VRRRVFEIHVKGQVPAELVEELGKVTVTKQPAVTVFKGQVPDQAALFGFLARFHALGLEVVEVRSLHDPEGTDNPAQIDPGMTAAGGPAVPTAE
jgi:hypothetical protein